MDSQTCSCCEYIHNMCVKNEGGTYQLHGPPYDLPYILSDRLSFPALSILLHKSHLPMGSKVLFMLQVSQVVRQRAVNEA